MFSAKMDNSVMYRVRLSRVTIVFIFLVITNSQEPPDTGPGCLKEEFRCSDGTCISDQLVCNGINDCSNGLDEFVCIDRSNFGCLKEEFSCSDGTCISDHLLCNGISDCSNGLDEFVCIERTNLGCPPDMVPCGTGNECVGSQHVCDGVLDCLNGEDESMCPMRAGSPCLISEYQCPLLGGLLANSSQVECVPRAHQCDGNVECSNSADETGCSPPVIISAHGPLLNTSEGSSPSLVCVAEGSPTPAVTWYRNLMPLEADPRYSVVSQNGIGVLLIRNVTVFDEGEYTCVASNPLLTVTTDNRTTLRVFNANPFTCEDVDGVVYVEGMRYYDIMTTTFGDASTAAADIVFVVDESGSMQGAHEWIRMTAPLLNQALNDRGFGVGLRNNMFALVGFGRNMLPDGEGIVLADLTSVEQFLNASQDLSTDGLIEDGYSGIEVALDQITLRDESFRIMIFVSNEARQPLPGKVGLTRATIEQRLRSSNYILNSVVSQGLLSDQNDPESFAFALDSNDTAYSFTSLTEFARSSGGIPNPDAAFTVDSTYEDYTLLALNLDGAVFDIRQLQSGGNILSPFTDAFVDVKVEEVSGVVKRCLNCLCTQPTAQCNEERSTSIDSCSGQAPPDPMLIARVFPMNPQVVEGNALTLSCDVIVVPPDSNIQITWKFTGRIEICQTDRAVCSGNQLVINNFMRSDEGFYTCEVSADSQTAFDLTRVTVTSPPVADITDVFPDDGRVIVGKPLELICSATGQPLPWIVWRARSMTGEPISTDHLTISEVQQGSALISTLIIDPISLNDGGIYECLAVNNVGTDNDTATINVLVDECLLPDGSILNADDSRIVFFISDVSRSVDIVLVVDESGSMENEQRWVINMTRQLDSVLQKLSIGAGNTTNRFGIVGFGSFNEEYTSGRILEFNGQQLVSVNEVEQLIQMLQVSGRKEDGYLALKFAFDNYDFQPNSAKQFILVTDEERDVLDQQVNRTTILGLLNDSQLGAVISQQFESSNGIPAIGIDSFDSAYIYDPLSPNLFRLLNGGRAVPDSAYGSTNEDYTELALLSKGSAWNLLLLRQGGSVAEAFTEAFVLATIEEIYRSVSRCLNCSCSSNRGLACEPIVDYDRVEECNVTKVLMAVLPEMIQPPSTISVAVTPSLQRHLSGFGDAELLCIINDQRDGSFVWTFNGGQLPEGVEVSSTTNTSVLRIAPAFVQHCGKYTCLVQGNDAVGSDTAIIEVTELRSPLGVKVMESEKTISEGQNITFVCTSDEPATYSWNFNQGSPLPSNTVVMHSQENSTLTITRATLSNQGRYFCVAIGNTSKLTDEDFAKLYVYSPILMISIDPPTSVVVNVGGNVMFVCSLDCYCPGASLTWRRGYNSTLPNSAQVIYSADLAQVTLQFDSITQQDCDLYTCVGEFKDQRETLGTHIILRESNEFEVTLNTNPNLLVEVGTNQSLICSSNSKVSEWRWLFNNGSELPRSVEVFNLASNRTLLFICDVQSIHVGSYQCEATSFNGEVANDVSLLQIADDLSASIESMSSTNAATISNTVRTPTQQIMTSTASSTIPDETTVTTTDSISVSQGMSSTISVRPSETISFTTIDELSSVYIYATSDEELMFSTLTADLVSSFFVSSTLLTSSSSTMSTTSSSISVTSLSSSMSSSFSSSESIFQSISFTSDSSVSTSSPPLITISSTATVPTESPLTTTNSTTTQLPTTTELPTTTTESSTTTTTTESSLPTESPTRLPELITPRVSVDSLNLLIGEDANITCTSNIPAELTWLFSSDPTLPPNVRFVQTDPITAILIIENFNDGQSNSGSYRCRARDTIRGTEQAVLVSINQKELLDVTIRPNSRLIATQLDTVTDAVSCRLSCICGGARVQWRAGDGGPLPDGVREEPSSTGRVTRLFFDEISFATAGRYICVATSSTELNATAQGVFFLNVLPPPIITVTPPSVSVELGETAKLICTANRDVMVFVWNYQTSNTPLPESATATTINSTLSELVVTNVRSGVNDGQYFCEGMFALTNEIRSTTGFIVQKTELVLAHTNLFDRQNPVYNFTVGQRFRLRCMVDCQCSGASAIWTDTDGGNSFPAGLTEIPSGTGRSYDLFSSSAQPNQSGSYVCRVFNRNSGDSITETVTVFVT